MEGPLETPLSSDDCLSGLSDDEETTLRHAGVYTDEEVPTAGGGALHWGERMEGILFVRRCSIL